MVSVQSTFMHLWPDAMHWPALSCYLGKIVIFKSDMLTSLYATAGDAEHFVHSGRMNGHGLDPFGPCLGIAVLHAHS